MDYTGERLIPGRRGLELLELEHRARYELAVPSARERKVLDLGCGTGYGAVRLAEVATRVVGLDLSSDAIEYARGAFARSKLTFEVADLTRDDLVEQVRRIEPEPFELVVCFEVLEHLHEPAIVLDRIKELLQPAGRLLVSTPNSARTHAALERDNPFHVVEYSEEELLAMLRQRFGSVELYRQSVHLTSKISRPEGRRVRQTNWKDSAPNEAKYLVALCSDGTKGLPATTGLVLSTSDAHLRLLHERLAELRKDNHQRSRVIDQMRSRLAAHEATNTALELLRRHEQLIGEQSESLREVRDSMAEELSGNTARLRELQRQIEERTAAGLELSRKIETLRREVEEKDLELETTRWSLEAERGRNRELVNRGEGSMPPAVTHPPFDRSSADLRASADEDIGRLQRRITTLEEQNARLIRDLGSEDGKTHGPPEDRRRPAARFQPEFETWRNLARDLAAELHHVLTSRRWRFAMRIVRLRNFLLRMKEGDPVGAHLYRHLRGAGQSPETFDLHTADALTFRRSLFRNRVSASRTAMHLLSEAEKRAAAKKLLNRDQELLVSVVMPTWNRGEQIAGAIESVRQQTYPNWELLIIDDGSTDGTSEVAKAFCAEDHRVQYIQRPHEGVSAARDAGVRAANGEIVAYLDTDNQWDPEYLLFMVNALADSRRQCAYAALKVIDHDRDGAVSYRTRRFDFDALLKNNYIDINAFIHRIELFHQLGGFDRDLKRWVDWDLILRYTKNHPPAEVPVLLCDYKREKRSRQITLEEPPSYKFKVLNKHLIDWERQRQGLRRRIPGMVSVVIPNLDQPEMTSHCVHTILSSPTLECEVIVVDNGSRPRNKRRLRSLLRGFTQVAILENYENYGFALGCNLGAARSYGEYIVWLNNDTETQPTWLRNLIEPLQMDPQVGIVGPKLVYPDNTIQHAGVVFSSLSKIPYHIHKGSPQDAPHVNKKRRFQAITGACMAIRASDFVTLRGFDPIYLNGCEDLDICFRLRFGLGKYVLYAPESTVIHLEAKSRGRSRYIATNRHLFVERWGDKVAPDDQAILSEDGFSVARYLKPGAEPDGETASYVPVLAKSSRGEPTTRRRSNQAPKPILNTTRQLNIGFSTMWYARGISFHTKQLAESLEGPDIKTHIFARWESDKFSNTGPIFHPRVLNAGDDPPPEKIVAWALENKLDLVIFMEVHPNDWKRVAALKRAGIKIMCYENLDVLRLNYLDHYRTFDYFLANAFYAHAVMRQHFPDVPSLLIPWGATPPVPSRPRRETIRPPLRFVHVAGWGGINNRKNTALLIRAFSNAHASDAELHIFTQAPLANYGPECVRAVKSNSFLKVHEGTIRNIYDAYIGMDLLVWPSKREGLGLPILEALALGLPALVTDGYMMKQWLLPGQHGLLCPATPNPTPMYLPEMQVDEEALGKLLHNLASDSERLRHMSRCVRRDTRFWSWSWQRSVLHNHIRLLIEEPGYIPPEDLSYIPQDHLDFEARRRAIEEPATGPKLENTSAPTVVSGPTPVPQASYLFVAGCQRSGTTALLHLLNEDCRIVLGRERFKFCRSDITPEYFKEGRFFLPRESETNYRNPDFYARLRERWSSGEVALIGDKVPFYYKDLHHLVSTFHGCRILFLIRDLDAVAASYNARAQDPQDKVWKSRMDYRQAANDWNESLERLDEFIQAGHGSQIFVVHYERFFAGDESYLRSLYEFLGLKVTPRVLSAFKSTTSGWEERSARPLPLTSQMIEHLAARRNRDLENRCLSLVPDSETQGAGRNEREIQDCD